MEANAIQ